VPITWTYTPHQPRAVTSTSTSTRHTCQLQLNEGTIAQLFLISVAALESGVNVEVYQFQETQLIPFCAVVKTMLHFYVVCSVN